MAQANNRASKRKSNGAIHDRLERIWATIASIPAGHVSTYGEVAQAAGLGRGARQVAAALRKVPASRKLPWHRVIQSGGRVAPRPGPSYAEQIKRLRKEGIEVSDTGRLNLKQHRWIWK